MSEIPPDNQANLEATIHRALELGINHIETARGYGTSEMQLGRLLPKLPRDKMIIQTKVAPQADPAEFLKIFEKSMDYLGLEYVDLLSLHGVNNRQLLEWSVKKNGCLAARPATPKEGRVRHVGFLTTMYHDRYYSGGGRERGIRLRQSALGNLSDTFELAGLSAGGAAEARHGRFHHQSQRGVRQNFTNRRPNWSNCARR